MRGRSVVSDNFYQGFMGQSAANANREIERANIKIRELRDLRQQDAAEIEALNKKLNAARARHYRDNDTIDTWNAFYQSLEGERDYLLALLDKAYGEDKNPARRHAYAEDVPDRIYAGKREGQRVTMRDHIHFVRLAQIIESKFPQLGCWKKLLQNSKIYD